jgi:anaerobic selenocysteine-containing dehydrogenase
VPRASETAIATCPLCEATCGLEIGVDANVITSVRGDQHDVFSRGYICPKGASLKALHEDPDRLRTPLIKRNGQWHEATWDEAFSYIDVRLREVLDNHGRDAVAVYAGNPGSHNLSVQLYGRPLYKALHTRNFYTAGTVDQIPKHFSSGYLFGDPLTIPVPDLDRTDYLLLLGANPLVSNGSLMTAPDVRRRLKAIQERGGTVVVIDPKRTRTAELADEHHPIRPGTDALLLFALVNVFFAEDLVAPGRLEEHLNGLPDVARLSDPFTPEAVSNATGIEPERIRSMARDLAHADRAAVYGRIGTTTQAFGTLASWLVDVLNVVSGNLDRAGGAMFPLAAAGQANASPSRHAFTHGRWTSRVRGLPEVMGELPVATLADEITTEGPDRVRALITVAGNPCLSSPNAARLDAAFGQLDFMLSLDVYLNETTRHADVILPGPPPLARDHYDLAFSQLSVRNVANWSPAVLETDVVQEWQTLLRLLGIVTGQGPDADIAKLDDSIAAAVAHSGGVELPAGRVGPARLIDILLRAGPYALTLADLEAAPHGLDLGPLRPRIPDILSTTSGKIELAPPAVVADVERLRESLSIEPQPLVLIGRRQLSSNNSWMHNVTALVRGQNRCTLQMNPLDAEHRGLVDGDAAVIDSRVGSVEAVVEVTDALRPGVVSLPHGWGHDVEGTRAGVARSQAGANSNVLTDDVEIEKLSGTAILNGIPVRVEAAGVNQT